MYILCWQYIPGAIPTIGAWLVGKYLLSAILTNGSPLTSYGPLLGLELLGRPGIKFTFASHQATVSTGWFFGC